MPQSGQCFGIRNGFVPGWCRPAGPTICGITSPARWTITSSPSRMSLRLMSSSLCSVARETVTPPTSTGSSIAHGLSAPVRPTRIAILSSRVVAVIGAHLKARAQRGRCVQRAEPPLLLERVDLDHDPVDLVVELDASLLPRAARLGDRLDGLEPLGERVVGKPCSRSHCSVSQCEASSTPSRTPTP